MTEAFTAKFLEVLASTLEYLPNLIGAILILLAGWLLARLLRMLAVGLVTGLNRVLGRLMPASVLEHVHLSIHTAGMVGGVLYWLCLLVFFTVAMRVAGFSGVAGWLDKVVEYLPSLLAGGLIVLVGYILSTAVRNIVTHTAASLEISQAALFGRLTQSTTFVIALVIGLDQIGIDVTLLITMLAISLGAVMAGFALAFGLGARHLVSNLIAIRYLREMLEPGQEACIGELRGKVLEFSTTGVVLETGEGRTMVPAHLCLEQPVTAVMPSPAAQNPES